MNVFASRGRRSALLCIALLLVTALWLFAVKKPLGRDNWFITPHASWSLATWVLPLGALLILGGLSALSAYDRFRRAKTRREEITSLRMSLGALTILAMVLPWTLLGPRQISGVYIVSATWSDISNQYFSTAYRIENARDFTRGYEAQQRNYDLVKSHVATHPPGAVLFCYSARKIYENVPFVHALFTTIAPGITAASTPSVGDLIRGQLNRSNARDAQAPTFSDDAVGSAIWCAFLLSLSVGLTVPAVYKLSALTSSARSSQDDDGNDERTREARGLLGAALFALAPTTMLFAFTLDALLACLLAWAFVPIARNLVNEAAPKLGSTVFAGALIGLASFVSFGALAIWGLLVFAFGLTLWHADSSIRGQVGIRLVRHFALLLLGFCVLWVALCVVFPMQPISIYIRAMAAHHAATLTTRSHLGWALLNPFFFALFAGWPLVVGALACAFAQWKARNGSWNAARSLGVATVLLCLALSLSGNVRGETERLWFFMLPPLAALASSYVIEYSNAHKGRLLTLFVALQLLQTLMMAATLAPLVRAY